MIYYLVYLSTATDHLGKGDLKILLEKSRAKNAQRSISGLLVYEDRDFIQILEGNKKTVIELFEKIKTRPTSFQYHKNF